MMLNVLPPCFVSQCTCSSLCLRMSVRQSNLIHFLSCIRRRCRHYVVIRPAKISGWLDRRESHAVTQLIVDRVRLRLSTLMYSTTCSLTHKHANCTYMHSAKKPAYRKSVSNFSTRALWAVKDLPTWALPTPTLKIATCQEEIHPKQMKDYNDRQQVWSTPFWGRMLKEDNKNNQLGSFG